MNKNDEKFDPLPISVLKILAKGITDEHIAHFHGLKNIDERLSYASKLINENDLFNRLPKIPLRNPKNNEESLKYRNEANKSNKSNELIPLINQSIAFAENNTKFLSIAYANRANHLFQLGLYPECLRDIQLIMKSNCYPSKYKKKLDNLRKDCETEMKKIKSEEPYFVEEEEYLNMMTKLTYPPNEKLPFIANCLESTNSEKYGRSIITTRDLKVGDIISIEQSFTAALSPHLKYEYCSNCLNNTLFLFPCPTCTSAMYCSQQCLKISYARYHKYECPIIDYLFTADMSTTYFNSIRNVVQAISLFKNNIDELMKFDEESEKSDITNLFDMDFGTIGYDEDNMIYNNDEEEDDQQYVLKMTVKSYYPIHAKFKYNRTNFSIYDAVYALIFYKILIENTNLKFRVNTKKHKTFLKNFIFRHMKSGSRRFYTQQTKLTNDVTENINYGSGTYPFSILPNHSCAPNILRIFDGSTAIIVVLRPIRKGEELLDCYGTKTYLERERDERQIEINILGGFQCECEACSRRYPTLQNLLPNRKVPDKVFDVDKKDFNSIVENAKKIASFLNEYSTDENYPCKQIANAEINYKNYISAALRKARLLCPKFKY